MTSQHHTGTHPFLWQASIMPVLIHFYDKPALYRYSSILHRYVYTHIYTYLCTYIYFPEGMFMYFFHKQAVYSIRHIDDARWYEKNPFLNDVLPKNKDISKVTWLEVWLVNKSKDVCGLAPNHRAFLVLNRGDKLGRIHHYHNKNGNHDKQWTHEL